MPEGVGYGPQYTASTGLELNIVGDYAYAYTGAIAATTSLDRVLDFRTGAYIIDAVFQLSASVDITGLGSGVTTGFQLQFNGVTVLLTKCDSTEEDMLPMVTVRMIIPPYTHVTLDVDSTSTTGSTTQTMVGRIYK